MNSADEKGFSADKESVVESRDYPPEESKPNEASQSGTSKRPQKHECAVCNKMLANKKSLNVHILNVHEKRSDFKCEVCSRCFTEQGSLKRHISTVHEKRADFKCEVCLREFGYVSNLKRHILSVHDKRCLLYTSPSPRDKRQSRMPSSA